MGFLYLPLTLTCLQLSSRPLGLVKVSCSSVGAAVRGPTEVRPSSTWVTLDPSLPNFSPPVCWATMTCWNSCQSLATPKRPHAHEVLSAMAVKYYNQGEVSAGSQVTHSPGTGRAQQGWNTGMLTPFVSVTDSMLTVSRKKAFSKAFFLFSFFHVGCALRSTAHLWHLIDGQLFYALGHHLNWDHF